MNSKYRIITDPTYGYLRADPLPSVEEVDRYYREEFYSKLSSFNDSSLEVQLEDKAFFDSRWESICAGCQAHFGKLEGLSAFDVGAGFGQALLYFRGKGMSVAGLEPAPEGVAYARAQGLDVRQAGIEDFDSAGGLRHDLVTVINVLEHLRSPAEALLGIRDRLLKPGGLLVLDVANEFNDFQTTADAEHGLNEWWLCPPNHINYFSATSLASLLERCGYSVVRKEASFPLELFMLLGEVYVGSSALGRSCHQKRMRFEQLMRKHGKAEKLSRLYQTLAELDLGRQVVLFATPAERQRGA